MHLLTIPPDLHLSVPDSFHIMTDEEKSQINFMNSGSPGSADFPLCLSDPDKHILITAGSKSTGVLGFLLSSKDLAKNMEQRIRKPMEAYGYRLTGFVDCKIGSESADGFTYEYTAQNTAMFGISLVIKHRKYFYYLHLYGRAELKKESLEIWDEILKEAEWG